MSRGVRDLRELICVSRLTCRESDEEDAILSDEERMAGDFDKLSVSSTESTGAYGFSHLSSPDSGCGTNGSTPPDLPMEDVATKTPAVTLRIPPNPPKSRKNNKKGKRREKHKILPTEPTRHVLPKPPKIPPLQHSMFEEYEGDHVSEPMHGRFGAKHRLPSHHNLGVKTQSEGNFDDILCYMDATIVSGWLTRANNAVMELSAYCNSDDNFVQFAQFWLTNFDDTQKNEIFEMEHEILLEELGFAFAVGKEQRKVSQRDLLNLVRALFREYPGKLLSAKGSYLFLNYLDILSSQKQSEYRKILSDVKCSTKNKQYAQWLLATRSFTLVGVWSAVVNFYRNLLGRTAMPKQPASFPQNEKEIYINRLNQAVRLGFVQVVNYFLEEGFVSPKYTDSHGRTLVFSAVMHNQCEVLHYLIMIKPSIDVNLAADTGNTPLHAAANAGNDKLLTELLKCPNINVNCTNPQCENATPLHLAVMHGHRHAVEILLSAGADCNMKMGDLSTEDIAKEFGSLSTVPVLAQYS